MTTTAVPLTGQQYHLAAGRYRATVTELGAGLRELLYDDRPLIAGYPPDQLPPAGHGQLLAPWPNRIDWLQVFTGDPLPPGLRRKALALEPMTCPANAFVTGDDLLILEPGQVVTHTWGITAAALPTATRPRGHGPLRRACRAPAQACRVQALARWRPLTALG